MFFPGPRGTLGQNGPNFSSPFAALELGGDAEGPAQHPRPLSDDESQKEKFPVGNAPAVPGAGGTWAGPGVRALRMARDRRLCPHTHGEGDSQHKERFVPEQRSSSRRDALGSAGSRDLPPSTLVFSSPDHKKYHLCSCFPFPWLLAPRAGWSEASAPRQLCPCLPAGRGCAGRTGCAGTRRCARQPGMVLLSSVCLSVHPQQRLLLFARRTQ